MFNYPVFLNVINRRCLVVGAGPVGLRKADGLRKSGASLRIVAPDAPADVTQFHHLLHAPADRLEWVRAEYESDHLDGVSLAFAAGPPNVNARVVADARARGIWANSASDPGDGDFVLPAVREDSAIRIAVGTGGASPRLAATIADAIVAALDKDWWRLVDIHKLLRDEVRQKVPAAHRADLWRKLSDPSWLDRARDVGSLPVYREMQALVDAAAAP
jgi:siroheme synthase-like protein